MPMVNKRLSTDSFAGQLDEARAASAANGGTALTTTAAFIMLLDSTKHVVVIARNFGSSTKVVKVALNPYALILKTANALNTVTDYSGVGQKNPVDATGVNLNAFDTLANSNALYIGAHRPFRGVAVTNLSANANASVLTVNYWNGTAWVTLSATDGTATGGKTQAQNGNVTWTVPSAWAAVRLAETTPGPQNLSGWVQQPGPPSVPNIPFPPIQESAYLPYQERPRFWTQWVVSAALSTTVSNTQMAIMNRSTAYAEMVADSQLSFRTFKGPDGLGNVEMLTDASTANGIVNCYVDNPSPGAAF